MPDSNPSERDLSGVDDVRAVRARIAHEHQGDLRRHAEETNRIAAKLIGKLGLKPASPAPAEPRRPAVGE